MTKITVLTADLTPTKDDLIATVNDSGSTPVNRKVTLGDLGLLLGLLGENAQTVGSYTLQLSDQNSAVSMNNAVTNFVVIPPFSAVAFPVGTKILVFQDGAGKTRFNLAAGVSLLGINNAISGQGGWGVLVKTAINTWRLFGAVAYDASSGNSAAGVAYTTTWDTNYMPSTTYTDLTDASGATGWLGGNSGVSYLNCTYASPVDVTAVTVGGGFLQNNAAQGVPGKYPINGNKVQYSLNGSTWTDIWTIAGVTVDGATQTVTYTLPALITAQYFRYQQVVDYFPGICTLIFT